MNQTTGISRKMTYQEKKDPVLERPYNSSTLLLNERFSHRTSGYALVTFILVVNKTTVLEGLAVHHSQPSEIKANLLCQLTHNIQHRTVLGSKYLIQFLHTASRRENFNSSASTKFHFTWAGWLH